MILIDTGPLVALCDSRDRHHARARKQLARMGATRLTTCDPVLVEACFHLPHRSQRQRLRSLVERLDIRPLGGTPESGFWLEVFDWLEKYGDHEPDWADGAIAALCGKDANLRVWTYDGEFRTMWRRPDGGPIPLLK